MKMNFIDHVALDKSSDIRPTKDGYMVAVPRVARTGIQIYGGKEVGMPNLDTVRVYRPESEVFSKDSLHTFAYRPITDDHPPEPVSAKNWKDYSVGQSGGEVARDGEFIRVPMVIMDAPTIKKVQDGKSELSVGYSTDLKWEKGVTPSGETYDAIQTGISVNHIAIVDAARGGPKLKIGDRAEPDASLNQEDSDSNAGDKAMADKSTIIAVDGISLEMSDTAAAVVSRAVKTMTDALNTSTALVTTLQTQVAAATKDHEAALVKATTDAKVVTDAKDAEIATLKKQVADAEMTPAKLDALVKDRHEVLGKAAAVLGDKLVVDGKTLAEVRRQVVDSLMGDTAKGWSDDNVKISFDTLTAKTVIAAGTSGVNDTRQAFSMPGVTVGDKNKLYAEADKKLSERWKGKAA